MAASAQAKGKDPSQWNSMVAWHGSNWTWKLRVSSHRTCLSWLRLLFYTPFLGYTHNFLSLCSLGSLFVAWMNPAFVTSIDIFYISQSSFPTCTCIQSLLLNRPIWLFKNEFVERISSCWTFSSSWHNGNYSPISHTQSSSSWSNKS